MVSLNNTTYSAELLHQIENRPNNLIEIFNFYLNNFKSLIFFLRKIA